MAFALNETDDRNEHAVAECHVWKRKCFVCRKWNSLQITPSPLLLLRASLWLSLSSGDTFCQFIFFRCVLDALPIVHLYVDFDSLLSLCAHHFDGVQFVTAVNVQHTAFNRTIVYIRIGVSLAISEPEVIFECKIA